MPNPRKLHVYNLAITFCSQAKRHADGLPRGMGDLANQLRRASASIALNTAEGCGEFKAKEKARFYRMARRSATECMAIVDIIMAQELLSERQQLLRAAKMLDEIQAMLTRLIVRFGG